MFSVHLYNVLKCTDDGENYIIQSEGVNSLSLPSNKKKFNIEKKSSRNHWFLELFCWQIGLLMIN